jgi:hypothetical protein
MPWTFPEFACISASGLLDQWNFPRPQDTGSSGLTRTVLEPGPPVSKLSSTQPSTTPQWQLWYVTHSQLAQQHQQACACRAATGTNVARAILMLQFRRQDLSH